MVRNFGEKRKKKSQKKPKGKGPRIGKEMNEEPSQELAIYEQRGEANGRRTRVPDCCSSKPKSTYRSKRTERQQRAKRDGKRDEYTEEEDEDDLDFGGEYDEIINTGPSRREAREAREAEQMASSTITFVNVCPIPRHARGDDYGTSRRGHCGRPGRSNGGGGRSGGHCAGYGALVHVSQFSMMDVIMHALADRLSM